jgi:hypothetical protein
MIGVFWCASGFAPTAGIKPPSYARPVYNEDACEHGVSILTWCDDCEPILESELGCEPFDDDYDEIAADDRRHGFFA